jgi:formiminotetrahydrofolate cyclodeaminase
MAEFATLRLDPLIAALTDNAAEGHANPVGGAVAALVTGLAASLAAAAAGASRAQWDEAAGARAQALALRRRAVDLAERDAVAYAAARQALAARGLGVGTDEAPTSEQTRHWELGGAVRSAAEPLLELAATAADLAQLAVVIALRGADDVRADAVIAALLAAASADGAARLVQVNLVVGGGQELAVRARQYADEAAGAAASARKVEW